MIKKNKKEALDNLEKIIKNCKKCSLCETAKNAVPGEGNFESEIVFIGEAPGAKEDETGSPFVGRAGKLLEALLEKIKLKRSDVWIGNVIKHRPPNNRDPLPIEIAACEGYLTKQLDIINPNLVVTLGRFAMNYFYKDGKITHDHGQLIKTSKCYIYPLYHPAAALRNTTFAKTLVQDFIKIPKVLEEVKSLKNLEKADTRTNPLGI